MTYWSVHTTLKHNVLYFYEKNPQTLIRTHLLFTLQQAHSEEKECLQISFEIHHQICLYRRCCYSSVWTVKLSSQCHALAHSTPPKGIKRHPRGTIAVRITLCGSHSERLNDLMGPLKVKKAPLNSSQCGPEESAGAVMTAEPARGIQSFNWTPARAAEIGGLAWVWLTVFDMILACFHCV